MTVIRETSVKEIVEWYKDNWGHMNRYTAYRIKDNILGDNAANQAHQFTLPSSYADAIKHEDPGTTVKLKIIDSHFSSLFVCPSFSRNAWQHLRPFIAVDAAFTKTIYNYVLMVATGIDANHQTITLAWGIAPLENAVHWQWFIANLSTALGDLNSRGTVIISDRQKGLNKAIEEELPLATEAYCCKHIESNLTKAFGNEVKPLFWAAVWAKNEEEHKESMTKLKELNERSFMLVTNVVVR